MLHSFACNIHIKIEIKLATFQATNLKSSRHEAIKGILNGQMDRCVIRDISFIRKNQ
jgi:hypothetical protein